MKYIKFILIAFAFVAISMNASAQKQTSTGGSQVIVTINNNHFSHVDLINAYGNDRKTYASADIVNDQFSMNVNVDNDIYRFDFGSDNYFLVVIKKGETIRLTMDADDLQHVVRVDGSSSMAFVKEASGYSQQKKTKLDSLNTALQSDTKQIYWSKMAQNINLFKQANEDADKYVLTAFDNMDSLSALCGKYAPGGKIKGGDLDAFMNSANKFLKAADNAYRPFASFLENVDKYYDFSSGRQSGYKDFYATLDQYMRDLGSRHDDAEKVFGKSMTELANLVTVRDSLVFNNLMSQKKNKTGWIEKVISFVQNNAPAFSKEKQNYQQQVLANNGIAASLVEGSQEIVKQIVNGYQTQYNDVDSYLNSRLMDAIKNNKNDIAVLMFVDMFPKEQNAALHQEVINALHTTYPEHPIVKERWNMMNSPAGKTAVGAIAPDLAFKDPDGNIRRLSDLRGKVVLLDFWASWCGPCRRESPNVRNVYNKYHDMGFEVFSVSLDRDYNSWVKAIKDDQLVWPNHVSDLKYWSSEAAAIYGVRSIPCMFLLDKEGRIVAKDLRGEALDRAVKQMVEQ